MKVIFQHVLNSIIVQVISVAAGSSGAGPDNPSLSHTVNNTTQVHLHVKVCNKHLFIYDTTIYWQQLSNYNNKLYYYG